ncbi:MAG: RICIN domain-containing protein [Firmicutes bacterium]|nr:RICIN domain-containing protein [Bacillota bacterium]
MKAGKGLLKVFLACLLVFGTITITPILASAGDGYEYAMFVFNELYINRTNAALDPDQRNNPDSSGHGWEAAGFDLGGDSDLNVKAPFTGKIVKVESGESHGVWFQSLNKVHFANGELGYMTILLCHDDYVSDLWNGQIISQGTVFYQQGTYMNGKIGAVGRHLHIEAARGLRTTFNELRAKENRIQINDALYLKNNTIRTKDYILVSAGNGGGRINLNWRIVTLPTTVLSVKVTGSQVTVNWVAVPYATRYDVYILQYPWGWGDIKDSHPTYGTSYTFNNVACGDYAAFVITRPNADTVQSTWYSFTVGSANIANGVYKIQGLNSGKFVDIKDGSTANGAVAHLWQSAAVNNQKFRFERLSDGTYKITAVHSGKSLEVRNSGMNNGDQVAQWDFDANYACKRWYIVDCGGGNYKFVNKNSKKVLDVYGNGTANGTKIQQWDDNGTSAQRFKLILQ